jgi:hypothetical protein
MSLFIAERSLSAPAPIDDRLSDLGHGRVELA